MHALVQLPKPIAVVTLADSVYDTLLEAIVSGQLIAGSELSVVALAKALQVSRTPVHEALRHLASDGLVTQSANKTSRVARFTADDVRDIFEMRKLLEGAAAERAATRITPNDLVKLESTAAYLGSSRGAADWLTRWIDFDDEFHAAIAAASGSSRLASDIGRYRLMHRGINRLATDPDGLQSALAEHQSILAALRAGDPETARAAMTAHIGGWQTFFVAHFAQHPPGS